MASHHNLRGTSGCRNDLGGPIEISWAVPSSPIPCDEPCAPAAAVSSDLDRREHGGGPQRASPVLPARSAIVRLGLTCANSSPKTVPQSGEIRTICRVLKKRGFSPVEQTYDRTQSKRYCSTAI